MRACGYEGADPLVIEEVKDLPEAKGARVLPPRQRRVDVLQQLYDGWVLDQTGKTGISEELFRAGRLFQADVEKATIEPHASGMFVPGGSRGVYVLSDGALVAMSRAGKAKERVLEAFGFLGWDAIDFALLVLLRRVSPSAAATMVGWSAHAAIPALRLILGVFARVYCNRGQDCV